MNLVTSNDLANYADRINREHDLAEQHAVTAMEHAQRAGDLLIEAKERVAYGDWLKWLKENVTVSPRMVQNYMKLARVLPHIEPEEAKRVSHLPIRKAIQTLVTESPPSKASEEVAETTLGSSTNAPRGHTSDYIEKRRRKWCRVDFINWLDNTPRMMPADEYSRLVADDPATVKSLKEILPAAIDYLQAIQRGLRNE